MPNRRLNRICTEMKRARFDRSQMAARVLRAFLWFANDSLSWNGVNCFLQAPH